MFDVINVYSVSELSASGGQVEKYQGWWMTVYLLVVVYYVVSVVLNLLVWNSVRRTAIIAIIVTILATAIGVYLVRRHPIWFTGVGLGLVATIWGQYWIVSGGRILMDKWAKWGQNRSGITTNAEQK